MRITSIAPFLFWVCLAASIDPPNPCSPDRLAFLTPVYKVHHFTLRRVENVQDYPHFDLEDEANRYSMSCSWVLDTNGEFTGRTPLKTQVLCDPQILQGYPAAAAFYYHQTNSLMITQSWVCDAKDGSWPTLIFANATMNFTTPLSCSGENCTLPEQALPSVRGTVRRPSISQPAVQRIPSSSNQGLNTVPDNETPCIGLSFSYPNWDVSELNTCPATTPRGQSLFSEIMLPIYQRGVVLLAPKRKPGQRLWTAKTCLIPRPRL
ncbi:hypothetical protein B0H66DRAFT_219731 [Apodospora peruviana]|uniref:AA1-like domain-containing protein n=1 Tax=Apodospora peruviana TaxID=516989 RepID=A0AAE0HS66_9PEZI|nr:hypothetical protein B0H66DRAFT_219731 [Apodospora peruviana]